MLNKARIKMKKPIFITLSVFFLVSLAGFSQTQNYSAESKININSRPGLINITELNSGIGIFKINSDYSKHLFNLSTVLGIGLTRNFTGGIGVGGTFYNGGPLFPLFADFRYFTHIKNTRVFVFGDGGILLNSTNTIGGLAFFVNPGLGYDFAYQ